jgi:hypothetical protein
MSYYAFNPIKFSMSLPVDCSIAADIDWAPLTSLSEQAETSKPENGCRANRKDKAHTQHKRHKQANSQHTRRIKPCDRYSLTY